MRFGGPRSKNDVRREKILSRRAYAPVSMETLMVSPSHLPLPIVALLTLTIIVVEIAVIVGGAPGS